MGSYNFIDVLQTKYIKLVAGCLSLHLYYFWKNGFQMTYVLVAFINRNRLPKHQDAIDEVILPSWFDVLS